MIRRQGYDVRLENFRDGACSACGESIRGVWK
jgi:hypothetical protein